MDNQSTRRVPGRRKLLARIPFAFAIAFAPTLGALHAQAPEASVPFIPNELIVLLLRGNGAPTPEELVENHRNGLPLPANLGIGNPSQVAFGLSHRARGRTLDLIQALPDSARARLERYVVFTYPETVNLEAIQQALEQNPHVANVEKNYLFEFSATPSDPLFPVASDPADYQWGIHTLNLPAAWDYVKGHAYIGLIDTGLQVDHPDLRPFGDNGLTYEGGNFRPQLSWDFRFPSTCELNIENNDNDTCVDEKEPGGSFGSFGHGTHVSGIVAATTDNQQGVAGGCWSCSIMMARGVRLESGLMSTAEAANGLRWLVDHGAQAVSMSFGQYLSCNPPSPNLGFFCDALDLAEDRDLVLTASPGNDKLDIEFPASDDRVMSIGGIEPPTGSPPTHAFWDRADDEDGCPCTWDPQPSFLPCTTVATAECGSNYTVTPGSAMQDLIAPAKQVLSTFYENEKWNEVLGCHDLTDGQGNNHAGVGYDLCTGTSMSSPIVAALAGILRSVNPLRSKSEIRDLLITNSDHAGNWDPQLGYGIPDAAASVEDALGRVGGAVLDNRLTPLFSMYSTIAEDHFYTTFPQWGAAAYWSSSGYFNVGPDVPGYGYFPGTNCVVSPCSPEPGASVYVFSTERSPDGHPLVPLYRLSFEGTFPGGPSNPNNRETTYTTEPAGIEAFRAVGYDLDGIESYIYQRCTPEPGCIPSAAVRLYRLYHPGLDDYAIFPESEEQAFRDAGYISQLGLNDWIGYVYENVDSDGDNVIDGFESLLGTDPSDADSDDDGISDGQEILDYPHQDPLDAPPTAAFTVTCNGLLKCSFDASGSSDDHGISIYRWEFGDGSPEVESGQATIDHTYDGKGTYFITLTVSDTGDQTASISQGAQAKDYVRAVLAIVTSRRHLP